MIKKWTEFDAKLVVFHKKTAKKRHKIANFAIK
jgi:hypothetical protein